MVSFLLISCVSSHWLQTCSKAELFAGNCVLRMSSNGRCCSIVWPEARQYVIFAQGAQDEWHQIDGDSGVAVAWAGTSSTYAVLYQPQVHSLHHISHCLVNLSTVMGHSAALERPHYNAVLQTNCNNNQLKL